MARGSIGGGRHIVVQISLATRGVRDPEKSGLGLRKKFPVPIPTSGNDLPTFRDPKQSGNTEWSL